MRRLSSGEPADLAQPLVCEPLVEICRPPRPRIIPHPNHTDVEVAEMYEVYTNASGASVGDVVTITCPEGFEAVAGDARVECHADAFDRGRWYLPYAAEDGAVAAPEAETPAPLL